MTRYVAKEKHNKWGSSFQEENIGRIWKCLDTIGCLPDKLHLEVDKGIRPVQHVPQKIPVAIKDEIMNKTNKLIEQKTVAKVNKPTDWISSMVVVKKPQSNKLRICIDPRDLNQAPKDLAFRNQQLKIFCPSYQKQKTFSVLDAKDRF